MSAAGEITEITLIVMNSAIVDSPLDPSRKFQDLCKMRTLRP